MSGQQDLRGRAPAAGRRGATPHMPDTIVVLRPFGRGNWSTVELRLAGRRAPPPLFFTIGQRVELAGQEFRVSIIQAA